MMVSHTYTCRYCGGQFTEECAKIGERIIAPPGCEKCCKGREAEQEAKAVASKPANPEITLNDTWPARHIDDAKDYTGAALDKARSLYSSHIRRGRCTLIIHGQRGRGKTGMATWWALQRVADGRQGGIYTTAYGLFAEIRRAWHPNSAQTETEILDRFKKTGFLVVDQMHQSRVYDAGSTDKSAAWERMALAELLDYRYREARTTILIATTDNADEIKQMIDNDILDRVQESGGVVECDWPSYR